MLRILPFTLTFAVLIAAGTPVMGVVVDVDLDEVLDDSASTRDLRERIEPMLQAIEDATDQIVEGGSGAESWQVIQDAAADGLASTLQSKVRECSKDYWAMTYAMFGLYYLASARALGTTDLALAHSELGTAMETTNLSESAYHSSLRDCGLGIAGRIGGHLAPGAYHPLVHG